MHARDPDGVRPGRVPHLTPGHAVVTVRREAAVLEGALLVGLELLRRDDAVRQARRAALVARTAHQQQLTPTPAKDGGAGT